MWQWHICNYISTKVPKLSNSFTFFLFYLNYFNMTKETNIFLWFAVENEWIIYTTIQLCIICWRNKFQPPDFKNLGQSISNFGKTSIFYTFMGKMAFGLFHLVLFTILFEPKMSFLLPVTPSLPFLSKKKRINIIYFEVSFGCNATFYTLWILISLISGISWYNRGVDGTE